MRAVLKASYNQLSSGGVFREIPVNVGGYNVIIRGTFVNGIPRIGTMYIP